MFSRIAKLIARQKRSKPIVDYRPALCFIQVHEVFRKDFGIIMICFQRLYYVFDYLSHIIEYSQKEKFKKRLESLITVPASHLLNFASAAAINFSLSPLSSHQRSSPRISHPAFQLPDESLHQQSTGSPTPLNDCEV